MELLANSLREAPVVDRGSYQYFVHPITDGIPIVEPALMREVATGIANLVDTERPTKILTAEAMGIHIATAVSLETDIPFVIARKRSYGFDDEVPVHQVTGYGESEIYVNGISPEDQLLIVDDVCSTGNTLRALTDAVDQIGATITDIAVVIQRPSEQPIPELPSDVKCLIEVEVVDGEVVILDTHEEP